MALSIPFRFIRASYVNPGDLVLQEADLSKVLVRAYVDEPDVGRLGSRTNNRSHLGRDSRDAPGRARSARFPPP